MCLPHSEKPIWSGSIRLRVSYCFWAFHNFLGPYSMSVVNSSECSRFVLFIGSIYCFIIVVSFLLLMYLNIVSSFSFFLRSAFSSPCSITQGLILFCEIKFMLLFLIDSLDVFIKFQQFFIFLCVIISLWVLLSLSRFHLDIWRTCYLMILGSDLCRC